MSSLSHYFGVVLFFVVAFSHNSKAYFWSDDVENSSKKIGDLTKERNELDSLLKSCSYFQVPNSASVASCLDKNGVKVLVANDKLRSLQERSAKIDKEIAAIKSKGEAEFKKGKSMAGDSDVQKKYTENVGGLLSQKKEFDRDLSETTLTAGVIFARLDSTVLGEYAKYVAREYSKSEEMKKNICKTINSCDAIKKIQKDTNASILSLESWREARDKERRYPKESSGAADLR